jgi:predicted MFS family arabinose efflux permease
VVRVKAPREVLATAAALSLAAAISLGLARFSYALLLPPMRADLGWSYFTAGAMNTANAAGYLAGALLAPRLLARLDARRFMLAGIALAAVLLALHGAARSDALLYVLRFATGMGSAAGFVGGGLLAARLAQRAPGHSGLVLGIYYGGVGLGIVAAALGLPPLLEWAPAGWPGGWLATGALSAVLALGAAGGTGSLTAPPAPGAPRAAFAWQPYAFGLAGYGLFGVGYIGYMTFVIALMREQGVSADSRTLFYTALGLAVVASARIWAGLLERFREGQAMALLNALLGLATILPALTAQTPVLLASGVLFGAVFLSVVASTTAWVRHNLPPALWAQGITGFTVVFAVGQVVGPSAVGLIADKATGLTTGLLASSCVLWLGSALALLQRRTRS